MKIIIKSKKVKESKKKLKKEDMGASALVSIGVAIGKLLGLVLAKYWPKIKELFNGWGKRLGFAIEDTEQGINGAPIPEQQKEDYLKRFEDAKQQFNKTLEDLQKAPEDVSRKLRPSEMLMEKAQAMLTIVKEIKEKHAEELKKSPESMTKLDSAEKIIEEVWKDIGSLDFISAISSQEDPKGLWANLTSKSSDFKTKFNTKEKWLEFTRLISGTVDVEKQKGFKKGNSPVASK